MDWKKADLEMMKHPSPKEWPLYPILPMKNPVSGSITDFGVILAWEDKPTIYVGATPSQLGGEQKVVPLKKEEHGFEGVELVGENLSPENVLQLKTRLALFERREFTTFEEMQTAGWMVD